VLRHFGYFYPPVDIFKLARRLQIKVWIEEQDPGWAGAVQFEDRPGKEKQADIWIRGTDSPVRQRFTLAHEIGHLMLHEPGVAYRDLAFYDYDGSTMEAQANGYAAGLLMPFSMLDRDLRRMDLLDVPALAQRYEVSQHAMQIRLKRMMELRGQV
jgi:Zn-dependent peptidase ImmA (M78 family)